MKTPVETRKAPVEACRSFVGRRGVFVFAASAASAVLLLTAVVGVPAVASEPLPVQRLAGSSGVETSLAVARHTWGENWKTVYVASNRNPVDALPAATLGDGPVVLTDGNTLSLGGVKPEHIVILGGSGAVPVGIENQARNLAGKVTRLAGADRNQTAFEIAKRWKALKGTPQTVAVTRNIGAGSPDAVAASVLRKMPILTFTDEASAGNLKNMAAGLGATGVVGLGGAAVVPDSVLNTVAGSHSRLAGGDRFDTAFEIAKYAISNENRSGQRVYLASGTALKDAMVAGANQDGVILLASVGTVEKTKQHLKEFATKQLIAVGGQKALPNDVVDAIRGIAVQPKPQGNPGGVYWSKPAPTTKPYRGQIAASAYWNVPAGIWGYEPGDPVAPWGRQRYEPVYHPYDKLLRSHGWWDNDKTPGHLQNVVTNPPQFRTPQSEDEFKKQAEVWLEYYYNQKRIESGLEPLPSSEHLRDEARRVADNAPKTDKDNVGYKYIYQDNPGMETSFQTWMNNGGPQNFAKVRTENVFGSLEPWMGIPVTDDRRVWYYEQIFDHELCTASRLSPNHAIGAGVFFDKRMGATAVMALGKTKDEYVGKEDYAKERAASNGICKDFDMPLRLAGVKMPK